MSKPLVTYFSATGTTEKTAKKLAAAIGADLYEIRPAAPYTSADLDWQNARSRSSVEMKDPASRPALADKDAPVAEHDTIFVGFPIWWYVAPRSSTAFWRAMTSPARRWCCLPPPAAAVWARRPRPSGAAWQRTPAWWRARS